LSNYKLFVKGAIVVTVITVSMLILFSTEIFKINTDSKNAFSQVNSGNVKSLSSPHYIIVKSNTQWEGSILDSSRDYTIKGSYGEARFDIACNDGGAPYSVVFNKKGGYGYLTVSLVEKGRVLDTQTTMDPFGGVQISGNCKMVQ
jgi:hypothetical protein